MLSFLKKQKMSDQHIDTVRCWYTETERFFKRTKFYDAYPLNEFWHRHNLPQMEATLNEAADDDDMLARIQEAYYFIVLFGGKRAEKSVDWQIAWLKEHNPELLRWVMDTQESSLVPEHMVVRRDDARLSVDLFRVGHIVHKILTTFNVSPGDSPIFFELGAGLGHVSRFIRERVPGATYIICDLPISVCFSYVFLKKNYPELSIHLLPAEESLTQAHLESHDIILTAPNVVKSASMPKVDVFINTCSLGEMQNQTSSLWTAFLANTLKPRHVYSLNRFLNQIDYSDEYTWRQQENGHLFGFDHAWKVEHFHLEDERFFGPYIANLHPRYLELLLSYGEVETTPKKESVAELIEDFLTHDWVGLYESNHWAINHRGVPFNQCLTQKGPLFRYWDYARRYPSTASYLMLLGYLDFMQLNNRQFCEEVPHLEERIASMGDVGDTAFRERVQSYITARQEARKETAPTSIYQHNHPGELAALLGTILAMHKD